MHRPEDWSAPGAWEVAPDVYRIPLPMPNNGLRAVNVYALRNGDHVTLIDSGWAVPSAWTALETALASLGYGLADIDQVLVTHSHSDHYTLGVQLRARFGTTLAVGRRESPNIEAVIAAWDNGFKMQFEKLQQAGAASIADALRAQLAGDPDRLRMAEEYFALPDRWLDGGEEFVVGDRTITAIHTPGHTDGHIVYVDQAARIAFTGDHVLPTITPSVGFEAQRPLLPLRSFIASHELMLGLPDMVMLPSHGAVTQSVHRRSRELIAYHERRLDECRVAVDQGSGVAFDVARRLGWTRAERSFDELDTFNQMLAVLETVVHLDLLDARGRVRAVESDGVRGYLPLD